MASIGTTLRPSTAIRLAGQAERRSRSLDAQLADAPAQRARHDEDGGVLGLAGGFGILLVQAAAVIPGLLPALLLALPLVLPVVVLGLVAGLLIAVARGIRRLVTAAIAALS